MRDGDIAALLCRHAGEKAALSSAHALGGGCIHRAQRIEASDGRVWFLKTNRPSELPSFEAEAEALRELAKAGAIRVPAPLAAGEHAGEAYLILEYIEFGGRGNAALMGTQLAALHRTTAERFGWHRDNFIGSTPQENAWSADWIAFFRTRRLEPMLQRLAEAGRRFRRADALLERLESFFEGYEPAASLLHGDLWGGNAGYDTGGQPVIFDPATYYGDREADLAMTELFGGFGRDFYAAYDEAWPLDPGYARRKTLYNLYHILNHVLIFGRSYAGQAEDMLAVLLNDGPPPRRA